MSPPTVSKKKGSLAKAKAARANGKKGGRPRNPADTDAFVVIEPPPTDPLKRVRWIQDILAADLQRIIQGNGNRQLSQELRATARAIVAAMPLERMRKAERLIRDDAARVVQGQGDEQLEPVEPGDEAPLCGAPRRITT